MANIKMQTVRWFLFLTLAVLMSSFAFAQGQSTTILPDGSTLMLGGADTHSLPTNAAVVTSAAGTVRQLTGLNYARTGHTATVLPDGTVFIFGGIGSDGRLVTRAELFDPATQQFSVLPDVLAVPRAFHTATLLTDGTLLLAGGVMAGGQFPDDIQLWDFRSKKAFSQHALLSIPRERHNASLSSDGTVLISSGTDHFGRPVDTWGNLRPNHKAVQICHPG